MVRILTPLNQPGNGFPVFAVSWRNRYPGGQEERRPGIGQPGPPWRSPNPGPHMRRHNPYRDKEYLSLRRPGIISP